MMIRLFDKIDFFWLKRTKLWRILHGEAPDKIKKL